MQPNLQRRIQRYGWDKASSYYDYSWQNQLLPAHDLHVKLADVRPGVGIVDIAAGTGLVTFRLADAATSTGKIIATDISDEMVQIGNQRALERGYPQVQFARSEAENLAVDDASCDIASCAFGMMYFPNPDLCASEMFRSLKPGGRAVVSVWGSRKNCGWAEIFPIVDAKVKTDVCPMFFSLGQGEALSHELKNAGFIDVESHRLVVDLIYDSDAHACDATLLGGPVALAYARFDEATRAIARQEYLASIAPFKDGEGYRIPGEYVVATGVKPA